MVRRGVVRVGAALLAGLVMGAVARLMMRLVALATGHPTEFSALGTAGILLAFVVFVVPGALLASLWRGRGRSLLLVAGTALLLVVATGIAIEDIGSVSGLPPVRWVALAGAGLGVYAAILALPCSPSGFSPMAWIARNPDSSSTGPIWRVSLRARS